MWKLASGISLTLCMLAVAEGTPPEASVSVQCCGRLRDGVVAIGGETTGTTITFNRIVWELRLRDNADEEFAQKHNKQQVVVTGRLRKVAGIETGARWIIDVRKLSEPDVTKDEEGARMTVLGVLRATDPRREDAPEMTIVADGQIWPIDLSADATLQNIAESLVGQAVLLSGSLHRTAQPEEAGTDDPGSRAVIRVKMLERLTVTVGQD